MSIAGTQLSDFGDLKSDFAILFSRLPEAQTKSMIDFFKRSANLLSPKDELVIVGHSLGGTLSQVASSIYGDTYNLSETYTFNSPGAKELSVSDDFSDPYSKDLQNFTKNRNHDSIGEKVVNVKGSEGSSFISEKGVDIGRYRIDVKSSSHSINAILEAAKEAKELKRYDLKDKSGKEEL
ncbi:MAG: hypothetical protein PHZ26_03380 [Candidatus Gracilibacteria bacterium]|nr:hypothetical protein [Candidatus Gracilibacteria bacterium]MDD2908769.1 hypothetical protein [Candidatus Gracilibacteria bacterium]